MMDKRVWRIPCLLLVAFVVVISTSSCDLPLPVPVPRRLHTARETAAPTEQPTSEPTSEPMDTSMSVPTNTPVILVLPTDTPMLSTATATKVLVTSAITATSTLTEVLVPSSITTAIPSRVMTATMMPARELPSPVITPTVEMKFVATSPSRATPTFVQRKTPTSAPRAIDLATSIPETATPMATEVTVESVSYTWKTGNVLLNGDFESGFDEFGIGNEWQGFDNVVGVYGWSDETWPGLVLDGQHAQMMRITFTSEPDQYLGIQQTVPVVKGEAYELTIHGLIRSAEGSVEDSRWGYRIEWGIDTKGRDSWEVVEEWYDTGWDDQALDADSYTFQERKATITPPEDTLTLFIRSWRKWGTQDREVDFVIDDLSLIGPIPGEGTPSKLPTTGAPSSTWLFSMVAALLLASVILILRQVRKGFHD